MLKTLLCSLVACGVICGAAVTAASSDARVASQLTTPQSVVALLIAESLASRTVPPELALAIAREGSNFDPQAQSPAGARGVMQTTAAIAREHGVDPASLLDPDTSVKVGVAHLAHLRRSYGGWDSALMHYEDWMTPDRVTAVQKRWRDYAADPAIGLLLAASRGVVTAPQAVRGTTRARRAPSRRADATLVPGSRLGTKPSSAPPLDTPAVTGEAGRRLRDDMVHARLSFRRALARYRSTGW